METETTKKPERTNHYGLSKKTNIALGGIAAITTAQNVWYAVLVIGLVTAYCVTLQYRVDLRKEKPNDKE